MKFIGLSLVIWAFVAGLLLGRHMPTPPKVEYRYRYFGDKAKPDEWLHKYTVHATYHVWVDDLGRYEEVTEEEYKSVPSGGSLKTRKLP